MLDLNIELPDKVVKHIVPSKKRHRVLYGGRDKGATWSIARLLLLHSLTSKQFIACVRETKDSMKYSSYKILKDTIERLKLDRLFNIQSNRIFSYTGSEFAFLGLNPQTMGRIKSLEDATICWVAESQDITRECMDILIPTIRSLNAFFYWDLNPQELFTPAYFDFIEMERDDVTKVEMCYLDNPWFTEDMEKERQKAYRRDKLKADHVWLGKFLPQSTMAPFSNESVLSAMKRDVPVFNYDPIVIGADIARKGGDKIKFYKRKGKKFISTFDRQYLTVPETVHHLKEFVGSKEHWINIDNGNIGAAVADLLIEQDYKVNPVNFGGAPQDPLHYANKITELYYSAADSLDEYSIPQESDLLMQLTTRRSAPTTPHGNAGEEQLKLESKETWAKRQGVTHLSPDDADAFVLTMLDPLGDQDDFFMVL